MGSGEGDLWMRGAEGRGDFGETDLGLLGGRMLLALDLLILMYVLTSNCNRICCKLQIKFINQVFISISISGKELLLLGN